MITAAKRPSSAHIPVMAREVLDFLKPEPGGIYVDATAGRGGHTRLILDAAEDCTVICLDRDADAITALKAMNLGERVHLAHTQFSKLKHTLRDLGIDQVNGVLVDLGVCSTHLDTPSRGFSYLNTGPLDMRLDQSQSLTAAEVINTYGKEELANIFYKFGDERRSRRVASALIAARDKQGPITNTTELEAIFRRSVVRAAPGRRGNPVAHLFLAVRIFVNDELSELERGLDSLGRVLATGGNFVALSFHSLEDRIIKNFIKNNSGRREGGSRHLPSSPENIHLVASNNTNRRPIFRQLTGRGLRPTREECALNRRARSAILRAAQRTGVEL